MSSFGVVLDASVLIPAAPRDTLLRAAAKGLYRLHWSRDILEEVRRNLVGHGMTDETGARRLLGVMEASFPESLVQGYKPLVPVMTNHPKDRHVLAAAVVAGAQVIVTTNLRHFGDEALAPYGLEAQSPDTFLTHLYDLNPGQMVEIIRQQAAALRNPPRTTDDVLANLWLHAPGFARRIRSELR